MLSPIKRRLLTRAIAIVPAVAVLLHAGEDGFLQLLVLSQVVLSLQLPFAILPLICFTSAKSIMGSFASPTWLQCMAYSAAFLIIALNAWLVVYKHWGRSARSQAQGGGRIVWSLVALFCGCCWSGSHFRLRGLQTHTQIHPRRQKV